MDDKKKLASSSVSPQAFTFIPRSILIPLIFVFLTAFLLLTVTFPLTFCFSRGILVTEREVMAQ